MFGAEYRLPSGPIPENIGAKGLQAFASINGPYNCWPYLRQEVDRLTSSCGHRLVLPLLRVEAKSPPPELATDAPKGEAAAKSPGGDQAT